MKNAHGHWLGRLQLAFENVAGQTVLRHVEHEGPLRVQRPFRQPDGGCQVYVLNPPGGSVGGDDLRIEARVGEGSRALLTAPGASKFYRSEKPSWQRQHFDVRAGAHLAWLPQESIVYDGSRCRLATVVELAPGASYAGWEVVCLGRPAAGESFQLGEFQQHLSVAEAGQLRWSERVNLRGGDAALSAAWGLSHRPVFGSFVLHPVTEAALERARSVLPTRPPSATDTQREDWLSATRAGSTLVCRYLGYSSARARSAFLRVWTELSATEFGCAAVPPRIWNT